MREVARCCACMMHDLVGLLACMHEEADGLPQQPRC